MRAGRVTWGMSVLVPIDKELTLRVPQFFCCNCGDAQDIRAVGTPLVARGRTFRRAPVLELDLPYCPRCVKSARRIEVGRAKKGVIAGVLAGSLGLVAMATPLASALGGFAFVVTGAVVFLAVLGSYAMQKPRGNQTSYHQPVRLTRLKRHRDGRFAALTLSFSHPRYARTFANENAEAISRGTLHVIECGPGSAAVIRT